MKKKLIVIVFALILVIAVLTNPSKEDSSSGQKEVSTSGEKEDSSSEQKEVSISWDKEDSSSEQQKEEQQPMSKDIRVDTKETDLSSNNSVNEINESNILLLDYKKKNPIKNMKSFTYGDEDQQINVNLNDGDTSIFFGKDHPFGIKLILLRDGKGIHIDLGEVDSEILDEDGELVDIEDYSIQVGSHDFNNDGVEEIIIAIGDGLISGQLWVYSYHKVDDIHKIYPLHLELNERFQSEVRIDDNKIYLPYGSQGLFEEFVWYEDRFLQ